MIKDCALRAISARERAAQQHFPVRELRISARSVFDVTGEFQRNYPLHQKLPEIHRFPEASIILQYLASIIVNQASLQDNLALHICQIAQRQRKLCNLIANHIRLDHISFFFYGFSYIRNKDVIAILKA